MTYKYLEPQMTSIFEGQPPPPSSKAYIIFNQNKGHVFEVLSPKYLLSRQETPNSVKTKCNQTTYIL